MSYTLKRSALSNEDFMEFGEACWWSDPMLRQVLENLEICLPTIGKRLGFI